MWRLPSNREGMATGCASSAVCKLEEVLEVLAWDLDAGSSGESPSSNRPFMFACAAQRPSQVSCLSEFKSLFGSLVIWRRETLHVQ